MSDGKIFYPSFFEALREIEDPVEYQKTVNAVMNYAFYGIEADIADLGPIGRVIYKMAKPTIDSNNKRKEDGAKGGRRGSGSKQSEPQVDYSGSNGSLDRAGRNERSASTVTDTNTGTATKTATGTETKTDPPAGAKTRVTVYSNHAELDTAIHDFIDHRKKLKKPMTDKAIELFCKRLQELAPGNIEKQIQLIHKAIERGWQDVYPDKEEMLKGAGRSGSNYVDAVNNRLNVVDDWLGEEKSSEAKA